MCAFLLSTTEGISVITKYFFPPRYMHVPSLKRKWEPMCKWKRRHLA